MSLALGAFLAGLLLAETEYALQVESDIAPYKGLLMGLFFMTVGECNLLQVYSTSSSHTCLWATAPHWLLTTCSTHSSTVSRQ